MTRNSDRSPEADDRGELIYLLAEHTGINVRIEFPEEWVDPIPDMVEAGVPTITVKPPDAPIHAQPISPAEEPVPTHSTAEGTLSGS